MKALTIFLLAAAPALQFEVMDGRGKPTSAVTLEADAPDEDGWCQIKIAKAKGQPVLVWPFDGAAKLPDGPEPVPAIVIQRAEVKGLSSKRVTAAIATPIALGAAGLEETARKTGIPQDSLAKAFAGLAESSDPFEKGVGLLYAGKYADAADQLAIALKQRQRQLTRVPSEIYAVSLLYGQALYRANQFDDAAVAFLAALKQRPSDEAARRYRSDALVKAGKPEAAER